MKKLQYLAALMLIVIVFACNNSADTNENSDDAAVATEAADIEGFESQDLSEYGIDANIQLPSTGSPISINSSPSGDLVINDGKNFNMMITPYGFTLEELKEELDNDLVYDINYLEEEADYIVYEKTIPDSDVEKEVHFIMVKDYNGDPYEIKSSAEGSFKKHHIDKMIQAAKSLTFESNS